MTVCDPQPAAGDSAQGAIDYGSQGLYSAQVRVFGQSFTDDRPDVADVPSNLIFNEELGLRAAPARSRAVTFDEFDSGSGNSNLAVFEDIPENPRQIEFSVTNPSETHSMIGFGWVTINVNYGAEYGATNPVVRVDGANTQLHELIYLPLPVHAGLRVFDAEGRPTYTRTVGGCSFTAAIGPNSEIEPGGTWADTINFAVVAAPIDTFSIQQNPGQTPAEFALEDFQPELTLFDWEIRATGMIL